MSEFQGLTAIVTGAGSGIGLATAAMLRDRGASVYGFDLNEGGMSGIATWVKCDISDDASVQEAFKKISTLDIVINNAAIGASGTIETATDEEWLKVFNINVVGIARVSRAALPLLRKSKAAAIVNTCSVAATAGIPNRAIYSATKGAVLSLTLAMATDHLKDRIRVNCVNPGTADTPWVQRLLGNAPDPAAERKALEARQPMGRLVSAEEVASSICYLASPMQGSTTGTSLGVDGGLQGLRIPK
ncbi:MAG: SDR family oxidoreductase [Actinomycetes bacterium]|nr:SDR family NAD(P)-dependent oxidoreductase [Actinomycetota bacterium]